MNWRKIEFYGDNSLGHEESTPRAAGVVFLSTERISCIQTYPRNTDFMLVGYIGSTYPFLVTKEDAFTLMQEAQVEL